MGADCELSIGPNGKLNFLFIDKGNKKVNVGNKLSDFVVQRQLGKGHFGSVSLVQSKLTNKVYVMKEIKSERYKKLWHIGNYWKDPDSDRIIMCRYESSYLEIVRVDNELDTDEIIEYAYLDDLI